VIILSLNSAKFIDIALLSLKSQTRLPDEVIVVDAGSTDGTEDVVASFRDALNINFIVAPRTSWGVARNIGIRAAQSDTICFLDSDDIFLSRHVEIACGTLAGHPEVDAVCGYQVQWNCARDALELNYDFHRPIDYELEIFESSINLSTLTIRKNILIDRRIFFAENLSGVYGEDWNFDLRLIASGARISYIQEPVSVVTERGDSVTKQKSRFWKMRFLQYRTMIENQHLVAARRRGDILAINRIAAGVDRQRFKTILTMLAAGRPRMACRLNQDLKTPNYRLVTAFFITLAWILPGAPSIFTWLGIKMGGFGHWRPRTPVTLPAEPALVSLRKRWTSRPAQM